MLRKASKVGALVTLELAEVGPKAIYIAIFMSMVVILGMLSQTHGPRVVGMVPTEEELEDGLPGILSINFLLTGVFTILSIAKPIEDRRMITLLLAPTRRSHVMAVKVFVNLILSLTIITFSTALNYLLAGGNLIDSAFLACSLVLIVTTSFMQSLILLISLAVRSSMLVVLVLIALWNLFAQIEHIYPQAKIVSPFHYEGAPLVVFRYLTHGKAHAGDVLFSSLYLCLIPVVFYIASFVLFSRMQLD